MMAHRVKSVSEILNRYLARDARVLIGVFFALSLVAAPASAQQVVTVATSQIFALDTKEGSGIYDQIFWLPNKTWRGSYTKSCPKRLADSDFNPNSAASLNAVKLNMVCTTEDGKENTTGLVAYEFCLTDVYNDNGHLKCRVPGGSYLATCKDAQMVAGNDFKSGANYLAANCKRRDGSYAQNFLNAQVTSSGCLYHYTTFGGFYSSGGDITNNNGALMCTPPSLQAPTCSVPGPGGACTVASGGNRGAVSRNGYSCGPEGADLPGCTP